MSAARTAGTLADVIGVPDAEAGRRRRRIGARVSQGLGWSALAVGDKDFHRRRCAAPRAGLVKAAPAAAALATSRACCGRRACRRLDAAISAALLAWSVFAPACWVRNVGRDAPPRSCARPDAMSASRHTRCLRRSRLKRRRRRAIGVELGEPGRGVDPLLGIVVAGTDRGGGCGQAGGVFVASGLAFR